ncbi:MAG: ribose-5-phosphate isomerase RpiA [Chthoniobacterales bacterium]
MPTTSRDDLKRQAAEFAVRFVQPGMTVGLGTGSTAIHALRELARRYQAGELPGLQTSATSSFIARAAAEAGLPLLDEAGPASVDVTIDGADEVDPQLDVIKGGGGALLHEKIVAEATKRQIIVVDDAKLSPCLGTLHPLPVEIVPFGRSNQVEFLKSLGAKPVLRRTADGTPFVTDEGNWIYDCDFGPIEDKAELAARLSARAGVAGHGLFLGLTNDLIIASPAGLQHRQRTPSNVAVTDIPI